MLRAHPYLGTLIRDELGARSWLVAGFPYRLHYELIGDDLVILHIRHAARRDWSEDESIGD